MAVQLKSRATRSRLFSSHGPTQGGVRGQGFDGPGQGLYVRRRHEKSVLPGHDLVGDAAGAGRDGRKAVGHGLEGHDARAFEVRRVHEEVGGGVAGVQGRVVP